MKHKKFNKIISALLLLVMALGLFPTTAFSSSDTNTVTITYDPNGGTIGPAFDRTVQFPKGETLVISEPDISAVKIGRASCRERV